MQMIPELESMWKEKQEVECPKEDTDDNFIPARLAEHEPDEKVLIRIEL